MLCVQCFSFRRSFSFLDTLSGRGFSPSAKNPCSYQPLLICSYYLTCPAGFSPPAVYPTAHQSSYQIISSLRGSFSFLSTLSSRGFSPSAKKPCSYQPLLICSYYLTCPAEFSPPAVYPTAHQSSYQIITSLRGSFSFLSTLSDGDSHPPYTKKTIP